MQGTEYRVMKTHFVMILISLALLMTPPSLAADCDEVTAENLNTRIETDILLAETSDNLDAAGQNSIRDLKEDFSKASDLHAQVMDSGDLTKLNEVCQTYEDILRQIEPLSN
jgi:hypothetical protein